MFTFTKTIQTVSFIKTGLGNCGSWTIDPEWSEEEYKTAYYDDWRDDVMPYTEFFKLIDYKTKPINVKGSHALNDFQVIFITTVQSPDEIYSDVGEFRYKPTFRNQIYKRIDCTIHLQEDWKLRYKKYIDAGVFDIRERLKKAEEVDLYDDKIVNREERIHNEFDIDKFDFEEFCKSKGLLDVKPPVEIKEVEDGEKIPIKKYYVYSHKKEEKNIFIESLLDSEYNEITFDGKNYKGDDWENSNVLLILNEKVPEKDFLSFIKEKKLSFKTRAGVKTIEPLRFVIAGYDFLNHIYPENEEDRQSWELYIKNIQIDVETRTEWQDLFSKLNLKLRKVCFDRIHIMVMFKKAEENIRRENEIAEENRKRAERDLEKQREKDLEGSFLSWNSDLF